MKAALIIAAVLVFIYELSFFKYCLGKKFIRIAFGTVLLNLLCLGTVVYYVFR